MDQTPLETLLRETLAAKADTIHPSPALWEQVADATTRRSRWANPVTWLGLAGAAALLIAALVIIPNILRGPAVPEVVNTPDPGPLVTDVAPASGAVVWNQGENEIGGIGEVRQIDPVTGENLGIVFAGEPGIDAPFFQSLAVRPNSGEIAALVQVEGQLDIQVRDATGTPVGVVPIGPDVASGPLWSEDGVYLVWSSGDTVLHLLDWDLFVASGRVNDPQGANELGQSFSPNGWMNDTDLIAVQGSQGGDLIVNALPVDAVLTPTQCKADGCSYGLGDSVVFDETQVITAGTTLLDTAIAVDAPGTPIYRLSRTAELSSPFVSLTVVVDGGAEEGLDLPDDIVVDDTGATTSIAAAGSTVMVVYDGRAWLLQLSFGEEPTVARTTEIEGGATVGALLPPVTAVAAAPQDDQLADRLVVARAGLNDIGGFGGLYELDPITGVQREVIAEGQPERDAPIHRSIAINPVTGQLASIVAIEGRFDLRLGQPGDAAYRTFSLGTDDGVLQPRIAWSQDGRHLAWTAFDEDVRHTTLWVFDRVAFEAGDLGPDVFSSSLGVQPERWDEGTVRLLDVVGGNGSELVVRATVDGTAADITLVPAGSCQPTCDFRSIESGGAGDVGVGPTIAASADASLTPGPLLGAAYTMRIGEEGTLRLVYSTDGDVSEELPFPDEIQTMDGNLLDIFLDAAGSTVVIGRNDRAWILTVSVDVDGVATVESQVEIPGGASAAAVDLTGGRSEVSSDVRTPATDAAVEAAPSDVIRVVVAQDDRGLVVSGSFGATARPGRPDGLDPTATLEYAAIQPGTDGAVIVSTWTIDGPLIRALTVVKPDGTVTANAVMPDDEQAVEVGPRIRTDTTPMFDPSGRHLIWVEPDGQGGAHIVVEDWDGATPGERLSFEQSSFDGTSPFGVLSVTRDAEKIDVHASIYRAEGEGSVVPALLRVRLAAEPDASLTQVASLQKAVDGTPVRGAGATSSGHTSDALGLFVTGDDGELSIVHLETFVVDRLAVSDVGSAPAIGVVGDRVAFRVTPNTLRLIGLDGTTEEVATTGVAVAVGN